MFIKYVIIYINVILRKQNFDSKNNNFTTVYMKIYNL